MLSFLCGLLLVYFRHVCGVASNVLLKTFLWNSPEEDSNFKLQETGVSTRVEVTDRHIQIYGLCEQIT